MLYVTGMLKNSGACCMRLGCLTGSVRVVCDWDIYGRWCWLVVLFSVLFVNCGDTIKVYFSIVTHEIPLRVRKKTHVGLNAQSGRQ